MEMPRSWWSRNWKWFVPTVIGVPILICAGVCGGIIYFGMSAIKQSAPYLAGLEAIDGHPAALAVLGSPIEAGTITRWNFQIENNTGSADIALPVSGPKGGGLLSVKGTMINGQWTYSEIKLLPDDGSAAIDLTAAAAPDTAPSP